VVVTLSFWNTRTSQGNRQGGKSGTKDAGARSMVTGGKQMDGFVSLFASIVEAEGILFPARRFFRFLPQLTRIA
jgi:hypothetical protein